MAQVCTYDRLIVVPLAGATLFDSGYNATSMVIATVSGAATSVSDGMVCDFSDDLPNYAHGAIMLTGSTAVTYVWEFVIGSDADSALGAFRASRASTGLLLTAATDLSGQDFTVGVIGG